MKNDKIKLCDLQFAVDETIKRINALLDRKEYVTVAIDGRSSAGKTTFAAELNHRLDCNVIAMDDFFLRPEQRTVGRINEPGGNSDRERFISEVLEPLSAHRPFSYRAYDCHKNAFRTPVKVDIKRVTLIEGAYSCYPSLCGYYDQRIFLHVDPVVQKKRIYMRNGEETSDIFLNRWIPLEEKYFSFFDIEKQSELCFELTDTPIMMRRK